MSESSPHMMLSFAEVAGMLHILPHQARDLPKLLAIAAREWSEKHGIPLADLFRPEAPAVPGGADGQPPTGEVAAPVVRTLVEVGLPLLPHHLRPGYFDLSSAEQEAILTTLGRENAPAATTPKHTERLLQAMEMVVPIARGK